MKDTALRSNASLKSSSPCLSLLGAKVFLTEKPPGVGSIRDKAGISQSTASQYLDVLQRCGLLLSERHGKWTYFRHNEEAIAELARFVGGEL